MASLIDDVVPAAGERPERKGIAYWICSTNHKDIGTLYLVFSLCMLFVGGVMALLIRAELFQPGLQFLSPELFNELTSVHGLVMIFGAIMPALTGIANWQLPLMLGAPDMAFPRLNNMSFWLMVPAALLIVASFFVPGGAMAAGWTMYPPLSVEMGPGMDMTIFAVHLFGISSIGAAINIVATIINMRAPGMTLMKMPMFAWTWLVTSYLLLLVMPVLASVMTMLLLDRHFGAHFFNAAGGGDPLLYQHIFWFFGHPEVYVLILPAFGMISSVIPAFSRKPLFGYRSMVFATAAIGLLSVFVWGHHMFTVGFPAWAQLFYMYATMLVAVPTGVKVFNWLATMWEGSITFEAPMLFAIGFIFVFVIGGVTGIILSVAAVDVQLQDSYYVVAHFHYTMVAGSLFGLFAGAYYWLPKWTGHMYDEKLAAWHFWLTLVFFNMTFFVMHFLGLAGMPRRIPDYALQFTDFNMVASVGAFGFGFTQLLFVHIVLKCVRGGRAVAARVWDGARGLEWTVPSPAPHHTFAIPPAVLD
jgi:cytochrome c oxidase subunit 1